MGRSRDENAVQFLFLKHLAVVCILSGSFRFRSGFLVPIEERGNLGRVAVANGLEIHFLRPIQELSDAESQSDDSDLDSIIGPGIAVLSEHVPRNDERDGDRGRCRRFQKSPPIHGIPGHRSSPG